MKISVPPQCRGGRRVLSSTTDQGLASGFRQVNTGDHSFREPEHVFGLALRLISWVFLQSQWYKTLRSRPLVLPGPCLPFVAEWYRQPYSSS